MDKSDELLIDASKKGDADAARSALKAGANIDYVDSGGWTAAMHAAAHHHLDVFKLLAKRGANFAIRDGLNHDAWDISVHQTTFFKRWRSHVVSLNSSDGRLRYGSVEKPKACDARRFHQANKESDLANWRMRHLQHQRSCARVYESWRSLLKQNEAWPK